ncbi:MAG: GNAT family N-acetyltransferase [Chloroflexota bacterium]|nr:MAG: GNAT family N-acetyltransferase [Chloroflexota bacterium]
MSESSDERPASSVVREVKALGWSEAHALAMIWNEVYPAEQLDAGRQVKRVARLRERGGRSWILRCKSSVAGYASVAPTPGLAGLYELDGFIRPGWRRRGLGRHLLQTVVGDLVGGDARQLYYALNSPDSAAARFLSASGFYAEHEERYLTLDALEDLPPIRLGDGYGLRTYERAQAITCFRGLYDASFSGLPWYQPYESDGEIAADLADAGDLLFLEHGRRSVGFMWLRWTELELAEIEPVGLLSGYRGQGHGRQLMLAGLHLAVAQGARAVNVGVWRQNEAAIGLYRRLGFRETNRKLFLAYDLAPER